LNGAISLPYGLKEKPAIAGNLDGKHRGREGTERAVADTAAVQLAAPVQPNFRPDPHNGRLRTHGRRAQATRARARGSRSSIARAMV
jgi:hypothetical protein